LAAGTEIQRVLGPDAANVGFVFRKHHAQIYAVFHFYSAAGLVPQTDLTMDNDMFNAWIADCHIADIKRTDICRKQT
jgi:hypothetical protein